MKNNYKNKIEKLLNRRLGYCLLTVSNKFGYSTLALKKNSLKNNYTLIYLNEDINSLEVRDVELDLSSIEEDIITIRNIGTYELIDFTHTLKNPSDKVIKESEIFRQIDRPKHSFTLTLLEQ